MVEMNPFDINDRRFVLITMRLPQWTCRIVVGTKMILTDGQIILDRARPETVMAAGQGSTLSELLVSEIVAVTAKAQAKGIYIGMSGQEALLRSCDEKKEQEG